VAILVNANAYERDPATGWAERLFKLREHGTTVRTEIVARRYPVSPTVLEELVPGVPVVSAFHNVSADVLQDLSATPDCDILICGDDAAAKERVSALVKLIEGLRPVDAGALEMSRIVESLTALLIAINRRHKVHHCGIRITGMPQ